MDESLKQKTFSGLFWNFLETITLQGFGFIQGVILARQLMPSDYGLIAMTGIFFSMSYVLMDAGFTSSLIRSKDRTSLDYSTVFITNIVLSLIFCCILSLSSSLISDFYKEPMLKEIVVVNALLMFLGSFVSVQGTRLTIQLKFKVKSIISVISTIIPGMCSVILAYMGYGVWSLIYPNFMALLIKAALYWRYQHWFPGFRFSWDVYKKHFSYGRNLMVSGILNTFYDNINPIVIGKLYSASHLGYYNKAQGYAILPSSTISGVLLKVTFPVLSTIQDDNARLEQIYRQMIRVTAFVIFPIMIMLSVLARPFVLCLLTEKWSDCIPYLQILCFSLMWHPVSTLNLNLLGVKGYSNLYLRLEVIRKIIGVLVLCVAIPFGIIAMCYGQIFVSIVVLIINTYYTGKLINVNLKVQIKDLLPSFLCSLMTGLLVYVTICFVPSNLYQIFIGLLVGGTFYILTSKILRFKEYFILLDFLKEFFPRKV